MKATVLVEKEIEFDLIHISLPVRYGKEDMPNDFPLRDGGHWKALIVIDTGAIASWPQGREGEFYMKVCDSGVYQIYEKGVSESKYMIHDYVPHGIVPGEYGDYVHLKINKDGIITNWPRDPDVSAFFPDFPCRDE